MIICSSALRSKLPGICGSRALEVATSPREERGSLYGQWDIVSASLSASSFLKSPDDGDAVAALEPAYYGSSRWFSERRAHEIDHVHFFSMRSERNSSALLSFEALCPEYLISMRPRLS